MGKKRKSKGSYDDIMDVITFTGKTTVALGALGAISNAVKK